mmetsp:Transcript_74715/g.146119  ORF Transcript_74715/g.146119 Transcript_74715/m.146119 type:complete len:226 (+) Transcript_74715:292-969(+)
MPSRVCRSISPTTTVLHHSPQYRREPSGSCAASRKCLSTNRASTARVCQSLLACRSTSHRARCLAGFKHRRCRVSNRGFTSRSMSSIPGPRDKAAAGTPSYTINSFTACPKSCFPRNRSRKYKFIAARDRTKIKGGGWRGGGGGVGGGVALPAFSSSSSSLAPGLGGAGVGGSGGEKSPQGRLARTTLACFKAGSPLLPLPPPPPLLLLLLPHTCAFSPSYRLRL